jgi:2,4-dichlorophenol 6-monooxygenase
VSIAFINGYYPAHCCSLYLIGRILFEHTVTNFVDAGDSVLVTVKDSEGNELNYRCQYLIGADGGRCIGPKIGVVMEGPRGIIDMVSVHFTADLSEYWDDRFFACHFINGSGGTVFESGAIVPMGPTWGRRSEEWVFHFGFDLDDENRFAEDKFMMRIRELLKLPDLEMKIHKISHWVLERVLANKYQAGRIFL